MTYDDYEMEEAAARARRRAQALRDQARKAQEDTIAEGWHILTVKGCSRRR
ncbi:hypothetical protein [Streptomyces sp. NPDC057682]|uniref:hypothetical protein n=1 Tax=Streptomyces sp. NPDC057682 TaxID=3346210 RepID=UPI0036AE70AE